MGKTSATIKLIQILSSRGDYVNSQDLADMLETNPRNIKEYIKEAEECGYVIESLKGVYGGYRLSRSSTMPSIKLTSDEKKALVDANEFLMKKNDFVNSELFSLAIGKLLSDLDKANGITPITMIDRFPLAMDKSELQRRYGILNEAIENQLKVDISYRGQKGNVKQHLIHPYKLFIYNGSWFVLAFNETVNDIGYFKFNRIDDLFITRNHFTVLKTFNETIYLDEYSMKKNGDFYHIKLEIFNMNSIMAERIYGKNQHIEEIDSKHIIFDCEMQNKDMILTFVLSLGSNCKVLEPEWLLENTKKALWDMMERYE